MKPLFPTAVILVCDPIHISHLNSILMLCDCVGERLTLEVALIGLADILKSPFSARKYPCALLIWKNGRLGELGHRWFLAFFVVD